MYERWITALRNGPAGVGELVGIAEAVVAGDFAGHRPDGDVTGPEARLAAETKETSVELSFTVEAPPVVHAPRPGRTSPGQGFGLPQEV